MLIEKKVLSYFKERIGDKYKKYKVSEYGIFKREIQPEELEAFFKENGGNPEVCLEVLKEKGEVSLNYTTISMVVE